MRRPLELTIVHGTTASCWWRYPSAADSPGYLLWRATNLWQRRLRAALAPLDLTHVQFVLLAVLWSLDKGTDERPTQQRLADHAGTDRMMTSQVLRALEQRGLVIREQDPGDGRARRLGLTPTGAELAERAIVVVEQADAAFFADVPDHVALLGVLRALAGAGPGTAPG